MEGNTNMPTKCINEGRPVYFSYARNSSRKPEWEHISDCMEPLLEAFRANNIEYRLDKRDIGMGDRISNFENEIGWKSEVVVLVFSDKYFRSMHCMYEFKQIKNALQKYPEKRIMCIKSGDFDLSDTNYILELEHFWGEQKQEYERIEYHRLRKHSGTEQAAWQNGFYIDDIRELYSFFSAINYSNAQSIDYGSFLMEIVRYYTSTLKQEQKPKPAQNVNFQPSRSQNFGNAHAAPPPVTAREPYYSDIPYSQPQGKNNLIKWIVIAITIPIVFYIVASLYGIYRLGFWGILAIFLPFEIYAWYKIFQSWINLTYSNDLKMILKICQWAGIIGASIYELILVTRVMSWIR